MNSIAHKQNEIVKVFSAFPSWEERYKHLMHLGKTLAPYPEEFRTDAFRVKGCQSQVWLYAHFDQGIITYFADSDAMIVKGLAALLVSVFSTHSPAEILAAHSDFLTNIGLTSHLSQSRANGLAAMVKQFKNFAIVFQHVAETKPVNMPSKEP